MKKIFYLIILTTLIGLFSCGAPSADDYQPLVDDGWDAFEEGDYASASDLFSMAIDADNSRSEAYTGRGWSMMRQDSLGEAIADFQTGSGLSDPGPDLYAGWGFTLNALKLYSASNTQAFQAVIISEDAWLFSHDVSLDIDDLRILEAENFFALENFAASLVRVQLVNPAFTANVSGSDGQAELAAEIERLRGL